MDNGFRIIRPEEIADNPFKLVGADWMLITAGPPDAYNTMTASWGGLGVLWNKNVCWCVIRPQRYTYQFIEKAESFTLSFFEERYRSALNVCGSSSGRDVDKAAATGLTPVAATLPGATSFAQARLVIECRKIYFQDLAPEHFLDPIIHDNYPQKDYHRMYFGEVMNCLVK
ncbi:MAG: flavin reductase family protein [Armatimonadota bacterium]|nr:flavin reductase family protein [Armatimonadota bacterium]